jgi:subtilisin family serine protease
MSTEDQNRAVVTVKKGVDVDALMQELSSLGNTTNFVPSRRVEMYNEKNDSRRNFDVVLTREEAEIFRQDPRVVDVRYGSKEENGIGLAPTRIEDTKQYRKVATQSSSDFNWAIPACTVDSDPFGAETLVNYAHSWNLDGTGVDVVIQDSGIDVTHPEWLNHAGTASRLQQINWPLAAGLSGTYTQPAGHYTDVDGHGTHCAGTVAGRLYGWARGANIHAITIIDNPGNTYGISASFNLIRGWHNLKGNNRPTVVNMSWGFFAYYSGITGGNYRGTPWAGSTIQNIYGMLSSPYNFDSNESLYYHPIRVSSVDADIEDCIDDGIILVGAAGNDAHKMDVVGGADYNNYFTNEFGNRYYHRGATPNGPPGVVSVGSVRLAAGERKADYSTTGPGVQIYAPGDSIQSSVPATSTYATAFSAVNYPGNSSFKAAKVSGTSMAAPQVAGVLACLVGSRTNYNSNDCVSWLERKGIVDRMTEVGSGYTDYFSFQTGANRYLRQPFTSQTPLRVSGTISQTR